MVIRGKSCAFNDDMADNIIASASDTTSLLYSEEKWIPLMEFQYDRLNAQIQQRIRTNIFHKTTVRGNVLAVGYKIESKGIFRFCSVLLDKLLLLLDHACGFGGENDSGVYLWVPLVDVSLPHCAGHLHMLVKGQTFTLPFAFIGG